MAKNNKVQKTTTAKPESIIIQEINVQSADRSRRDIGTFKSALISAESVHNPNISRLFDLYDNILLDGHLSGIISKRWNSVINKGIFYQDKSGKKVDAMTDLIEDISFRELMIKILETQAWGRCGFDFIPGANFAWEEIPRKHIRTEFGIISTEQNGYTGFEYKELTNVWVTGKKKDFGFLLKCSPYAIYKSGNYGDWSQYIEIFGQPVRIVYYDAYDHKTKMELKQVLDESGSSLALMIPKQAQFEMKDGKQSNGDGKLQESFKKALDDEMSVIVLGNTETTSSSKSSGYAQSQTHQGQQMEITKSDILYLKSHLNSEKFKGILRSYSLPSEGKFVFEREIDLEKLKTRWFIDKELSEKVPMEDDYFYEEYGVPKPANYEELKQKKEDEKKQNNPQGDPDYIEDHEEEESTETGSKDQGKGGKKKEGGKPKATDSNAKKRTSQKNLFYKIRIALADFFDQAP